MESFWQTWRTTKHPVLSLILFIFIIIFIIVSSAYHSMQKKDHIFLCAGNSSSRATSRNLRAMSHEAIYRQPVPGNLHEEKTFTIQCSYIFLGDHEMMRHCLKNYSCAIKVALYHALQLVASKLPVKVASCDKALRSQGSFSGSSLFPKRCLL